MSIVFNSIKKLPHRLSMYIRYIFTFPQLTIQVPKNFPICYTNE